MSFYDDASLVLIPSGYKAGKVYSQKPLSTDGELTFTRASHATRVDVNGLIEKGRENLLLQSNQFDTTWGSATSTLTSGQSGYDGSNDAWKIAKNQANAQINQSYSDTSVKTLSIYAKADTLNWIAIVGASGSIGYFDLLNGVVGTTGGSVIDANIESAGGGWWRCSVSSAATTSSATIYPADADNDISGTSGSIYIQDAQLEKGLVATDYIETTTAAVTVGIYNDVPRLDYSGGSCPALLLEPQRTNLATSSEYFEQVFTEQSGVSWEHNSTTSPEGVQNAAKLSNTSNNNGAYYVSMSFTDNDTMTASIFAKQGSQDVLQFGVSNQNESKSYYYRFNLSEGTASYYANNGGMLNGTGSIEDYGNGWYRCIVTATFPSSGTTSGGVFPRVVGTGNLYLYGLQVEKNVSYATSYIPTYGSTVTRSNDLCYQSSAPDTTGIKQYRITFEVGDTTDEQQVIQLYNATAGIGLGVTVGALGSAGVLGSRILEGSTTHSPLSWSGLLKDTKYELLFTVDWVAKTISNATLNGVSPDGTTIARVSNTEGLYLGSRFNAYYMAGDIKKFLIVEL